MVPDMSKAELLQQIRESESRNAASLEQAASDRQAALRQAQQDRLALVEKARATAEKQAARDLEKERKQIATRKQALLKEGLADVAKLRKSAEKKCSKAAGEFVARFLESFDA
uniref:Uncharacterized protein n=1 Tax=uncultured marine group II/III euryarchaeote KM3_177_A07 TaxID=1457938 RepID=A0A075GSV1_9EURY|nr:hypothetical protein [uncultured marine group II/III euryarchaeote KM3_177_A07]